jgi:hypothetical protein
MNPDLGRWLNTVDRALLECPGCRKREALHVFEHAVRWECGHTHRLPPLPKRGNNAATHLAPLGAR